jgi:hypothetical protein
VRIAGFAAAPINAPPPASAPRPPSAGAAFTVYVPRFPCSSPSSTPSAAQELRQAFHACHPHNKALQANVSDGQTRSCSSAQPTRDCLAAVGSHTPARV